MVKLGPDNNTTAYVYVYIYICWHVAFQMLTLKGFLILVIFVFWGVFGEVEASKERDGEIER